MKYSIGYVAGIAAVSAIALGGCANANNPLTTASIDQTKMVKAKKLDPACVALTAKIDGLRKDGIMLRLAKVSKGKTTSTRVKRSALAKAAELDQANAEFQAKCSRYGGTMAAAAPAKQGAQAAVIEQAQQAAKAKATSGIKSAATGAALKAATN